jgi:two-component system NarL family response regulator
MKAISPALTKTPRVIIADDHELFRKALSLTLEGGGINIIEAVSSGKQAVDSAIKHNPDILILDIVMPDLDGLAALSIIKYLAPEIKVVVITSIADPEYMSRAGELGADAFFSKGVTSKMLINTIHALATEETSKLEIEDINEPAAPTVPCIHLSAKDSNFSNDQNLTDQEIVVLSLISIGHDNNSILDQLCISKNTLKSHISNIYGKIGVNDRTQAALWAIKNGFGEKLSISLSSN